MFFIRAECDHVTELCVCLGAVRGSESSIGGAQRRSGETEGAEHTAAAALPDELHVKHTAWVWDTNLPQAGRAHLQPGESLTPAHWLKN